MATSAREIVIGCYRLLPPTQRGDRWVREHTCTNDGAYASRNKADSIYACEVFAARCAAQTKSAAEIA
jgi:hypothetical protein